MPTVVTRFAPSPTHPEGKGLHVGGLRTAYLNYVFACQNHGKFLVRCEDTDEERSNEKCLIEIVRDLKWAGIEANVGITLNEEGNGIKIRRDKNINIESFRQSERKERYSELAKQMIANNHAYEKDGAIWFRAQKFEKISFFDEIIGPISFRDKMEDFVLIKKTGMPSFYMAVAVDDYDMRVTHIIRGQEHINTTFRQILIMRRVWGDSLEQSMSFAHIPLIMDEEGNKLSKRRVDQQVLVSDFRQDGYLANPLLNYLSTIGWTHPKKLVIFDTVNFLNSWSLDRINKANGRFDYKKLLNINYQYIQQMKHDAFVDAVATYFNNYYPNFKYDLDFKRLNDICAATHSRTHTLKDVADFVQIVLSKTIDYKDRLKINKPLITKILDTARALLKTIDVWNPQEILFVVRNIMTICETDMTNTSQAIRFALTGKNVSPPIEATIYNIGQQNCIARIESFLAENK